MISFVILQNVLHRDYRIKEAWQNGELFRQRTQLDLILEDSALEEDDETNGMMEDHEKSRDRIGSEQQKYRLIATKLRYVSFAIEGIVAFSVIALVTMNTLIRMSIDNEIYGSLSN